MPPTPVLLEFTCGACDALDDFTSYLTPDKLEDLYAMIDGNFVGLGIELKSDREGLRLVGVIRGGPAWEAGLHSGRPDRQGCRPVRQGTQPGRGCQPPPGSGGDEHRPGDPQQERRAPAGPPDPPPRRCREHYPGQDR